MLPLQRKTGFVGRVARHRSAKPITAVRIRHGPQDKQLTEANSVSCFVICTL